ncbi:bcl-2-binding component 3 isoform X1 [Camelus bactrianus]|uniref:Bcl-2-binding component 3 isoform X1 n=4 Tax=Camelus bactrianus TaxID=9837 RepID=A0AC58QT50_CAMBA
MGCRLGSAPWRPVRPRGSESTPTAPAPAVREGRGGGVRCGGAATPRARARWGRRQGGGSRAVESAAPAGGGCAPATAGYWPRARLAGGAGARGGGGVGGAVTAQGGVWAAVGARVCGVVDLQAPGSAMARARQEGSSPEPVEGLARDGPRPFPLSRLVPSAVSCGLCEPGLPAAPAVPALLPAAYLCAPTAPTAVTAALGGPRWSGGPRSRPRGPRLDDPQPSLSPAEQHLESPVPSAPGALAGGPTQAAPGVRGEEEQWAREIGAQLRRMADDLNALYERRRQEEQQRHRPSPWRVLYNLIMGLLPLPRGRGTPEVEPN